MYDIIEAAEGLDETGLPGEAYVPAGPAGQGQPGQQPFPGQGDTLGSESSLSLDRSDAGPDTLLNLE